MSEVYDVGTKFLRFEREGHIAWCTIDRPQSRNALTSAMYYGIKKAVALVNSFPEPTALILTGVDDVFAPGGERMRRVEWSWDARWAGEGVGWGWGQIDRD